MAATAWANGQYESAIFSRNITRQVREVAGIDFNHLSGFINDPRTVGAQFKRVFRTGLAIRAASGPFGARFSWGLCRGAAAKPAPYNLQPAVRLPVGCGTPADPSNDCPAP